jgi:hypothetical protein
VTNYARNEDTWVWGLDALEARLSASHGPAAWPALWREMRRRAAAGVAAALPSLHAAHAWLRPRLESYGFQMVGLDFLIDTSLVPWLLEFNSAPSIMAVHSDASTLALIRGAKGEMLSDVAAMVEHRLEAFGGGGGGGEPDGGGGGGGGGAGGRRLAARPARRPAAADWRRDAELEVARRGGFEPLLSAFPYGAPGIPWADEDGALRRLWRERGWPWPE